MLALKPKPDLSAYVSPHVFDGVRPLTKAQADQVRANYARTHGALDQRCQAKQPTQSKP